MSILILEALGAGALLIFIVWWTMFSGRKGGELSDHPSDSHASYDTPPQPGEHATPTDVAKPQKDLRPGA